MIKRTERWVSAYVVGLGLCPFAETVVRANRLVYRLSDATEPIRLLQALGDEIQYLVAQPASKVETILLIHPWVLQSFVEYNDFLGAAEDLLEDLGRAEDLQIASFHPDYCFAGEPPDDPANLTNRSPYPMLHLLRQDSISAVLDAGADTDAIVNRNIERLRAMSPEEHEKLRGQGEVSNKQ
ncbi:MAG: DUF1415 domain-containing protein [Burkholderiaceae bacterium]